MTFLFLYIFQPFAFFSLLLLFFLYSIKFFIIFSSQQFQVLLQSRFQTPDLSIPVQQEAQEACCVGAGCGKEKLLHKRSYWEANEHLSFVISVQVQEIKPHFLLQFVLFFVLFLRLLEIVACCPKKPDRETYTVDVLILLTTSQGWSLAAEVGQDSQSVADEDGGGA